jgi:hypothetical protein
MTPESIGAVVGGAVSGGIATIFVVSKWLVPMMKIASDRAALASTKAEAASAIGARVAQEVGVGDPGPRLADTVSIIAQNTDQIIATQRLHGERLQAHDQRLTRIEDHPILQTLEVCPVQRTKARPKAKRR